MNNVKNLWQENKKLVILYGLGGFFILLILIFVIIILMNVLRTYKYNDVEQIMVEKTEKYLKQNSSFIPNDGEEITIDNQTLTNGKYMKELSKKKKKDSNCTGEVLVNNNKGQLRYTPLLKCDNYKTASLTEKILETEEIKNEDDGLYFMNNYYTYRGEYLNNYIQFAGFSWRILKFNSEKIMLILSDTINNKTLYVFDDRSNEWEQKNSGKNTFENSRIENTLQNIYTNDFVNYHKYILPTIACVHKRATTDQDKAGAIDCSTTVETNLSLLSVYDYLNVSLDPLCKDATSQSCRNYNYLATTKNKWWLINGTDDKTDTVFAASSTGVISVDKAASKRDIRPVLSIPTNLVYKSGNGSQNDPYTFYEY